MSTTKRSAHHERLIVRASKARAEHRRHRPRPAPGANVGRGGFELEAHVLLTALGALNPAPQHGRSRNETGNRAAADQLGSRHDPKRPCR